MQAFSENLGGLGSREQYLIIELSAVSRRGATRCQDAEQLHPIGCRSKREGNIFGDAKRLSTVFDVNLRGV
jgi:hypothetical protein